MNNPNKIYNLSYDKLNKINNSYSLEQLLYDEFQQEFDICIISNIKIILLCDKLIKNFISNKSNSWRIINSKHPVWQSYIKDYLNEHK